MPKPTKHATLICTVLSFLAFIGIIIGLFKASPLIITLFLLPAVVYEVYRTEGKSTKASSVILLIVFILEIILLTFNFNFNLAKFLGKSSTYIASYNIPLGDIKVLGSALMAVLSVILFIHTNGPYTKWLSLIIFITSFAIIYSVDPVSFANFLRMAVQNVMHRI